MSSNAPPPPPPPPLFQGGTYPSQHRDGPVQGYQGEYRGYYPRDRGVWAPEGSTFGGRNDPRHKGLDIYAPYAPTPLEIPVLALVGGDMKCRYGHVEPNGLGNRAEIRPEGGKIVYSYGHLSRFEGRSRKKVVAGEVIGYAGCSGNANTQGECTTVGACHVNAGHVHLSVRDANDVNVDPLKHVALDLRFGPNTELAKEKPCIQWVHPETGQGHKQPWQAPAPDKDLSRLSGGEEEIRRRVKGKRNPLEDPFALLEFDEIALLRDSRRYYDLCSSRFDKLQALTPPAKEEKDLSASEKLLKAFLVTRIEAAEAAFVSGAEQAAEEMRKRVFIERAVIGLGAADTRELIPGWLLRHVSVLEQMLWTACGGAALDHVASNQTKHERNAYANHFTAHPDAQFAKLRCLGPLECGAGVGGSAWLSAADGGRSAVHLTSVRSGEGEQAKDHWVFSVTFGAGSFMHATVSERFADPTFGGTAESAAIETGISQYLEKLFIAFSAIVDIHWLAGRHLVHLSNEASGEGAEAERVAVLKEMEMAIRKASDALAACPAFLKGHSEATLARALLRRFAAANTKLFEALIAEAQKVEGNRPIGPSFKMLQAVDPKGR